MTTMSRGPLREVESQLDRLEHENARLQRELDEAKKPRQRVLLVGGPQDGDMQLVALPPGDRYITTVTPGRKTAPVVAWSWDESPLDFGVQQHFYRLERVRTGDGERFIGLYERTC